MKNLRANNPEAAPATIDQGTESREQNMDIHRAEKYWRDRLEGEKRIKKPMRPECKITVVIPVHRESTQRLARQLESFQRQKGIEPTNVELLYVVNNDLDDGSDRFQETKVLNNAVIEFLEKHAEASILPIHIIDKSSSGNELLHCNVGRARNRGIAEASLRFHEQRKNGVLLQTDADTWCEDELYLAKLVEIMDNDPDIIGIAGELHLEWDPDTKDRKERAQLQKKIEPFKRLKLWRMLSTFYRNKGRYNWEGRDLEFIGPHMVSRSLETAVIGGCIDASMGEDNQFGYDLRDYANNRGQKILGKQSDLFLTTALRDSDRTAASFRKDFDRIDADHPLSVFDVLSEPLSDFRARQEAIFRSAFDEKNESNMRGWITTILKNESFPEEGFLELFALMRKQSPEEARDGIRMLRVKYFGERDIIREYYDQQHPQVELTDEYLSKLAATIRQMPNGDAFIERLYKELSQFVIHIPSDDHDA